MVLLLTQASALARKNFIVLLRRHPISTLLRAVVVPLLVILLVGLAEIYLNPVEHYGIGSSQEVISLPAALRRSPSHHVLGFSNGGHVGGDADKVISYMSKLAREGGKTVKVFKSRSELFSACETNIRGVSPCFAGIDIRTSPSEPVQGGVWNYTIMTESSQGQRIDVRANNNLPQTFIYPLQRELEAAMQNPNSPAPKPAVTRIITGESEESRKYNQHADLYIFFINLTGFLPYFALLPIATHLPGFVSGERESGMSSLIDAMMPVSAAWKSQFVRLASTYGTFSLIYAPGWLAVGIVLATRIFTLSSAALSIVYSLLAGFALASFSLFGSAFFRRAQLSPVLVTLVSLLMAIVPQVVTDRNQTDGLVYCLSLLFPASNFTYYMRSMAVYEREHMRASLVKEVPPLQKYRRDDHVPVWHIRMIVFWVFLLIQIIVYPLLAVVVERQIHGTVVATRKLKLEAEAPGSPSVRIQALSKTYRPSFLARIFRKKKADVHAVTELGIDAYRGHILTLLGPNGSGKSTTLNCLAGSLAHSSGTIDICSTGGFGMAPQSNIMWKDLTVEEHIRIFAILKSNTENKVAIKAETEKLIAGCDLELKRKALSKTLSGGQKRKLQLAMMFAGGSAVCCVDEVSSGLDPISRRKVWDILLAERKHRTIIMTTHFLDEADFLADNIIIMAKGKLAAQGSSSELKHRLGKGYTVVVATEDSSLLPPSTSSIEKEGYQGMTTYRISDSAHVASFIKTLEAAGITDYHITGPKIEELFLKIAEDSESVLREDDETSPDDDKVGSPSQVLPAYSAGHGAVLELQNGRHTSTWAQIKILVRKRLRVLRRQYMPYAFPIALAIAGAAVSPKLMNIDGGKVDCIDTTLNDLGYVDYGYNSSIADKYGNRAKYVLGPTSKITDEEFERFVRLYNKSQARYQYYTSSEQNPFGFANISEVKSQFIMVETKQELEDYMVRNQREFKWNLEGAVFLSDPVMLVSSIYRPNPGAVILQNIATVLRTDVPIQASHTSFKTFYSTPSYNFAAIMFMFYYGIISIVYPAFFIIYPTAERVHSLRAMQYSNGVRSLPLWIGHLLFDGIAVIIISTASTGIFAASPGHFVGVGYLWLVLMLYGLASTLLSYLLSMIAPTPAVGWTMAFLGQTVCYAGVWGGGFGVGSSFAWEQIAPTMDKIVFTVGIISPSANLVRGLSTSLGQFTQNCRSTSGNLGHITQFGGPILYLTLQSVVFFIVLLWWDRGTSIRSPRRSAEAGNVENDIERHSTGEKAAAGLQISNLSKKFGKKLVLDDVSFSVAPGTVFALLGPNGAGKSTTISLVRGDIRPSSKASAISIAGVSALHDRTRARTHLGVCPQFDAVDRLTVEEMLTFFGRVRGIEDVSRDVNNIMEACGITQHAKKLTTALSGGTLRKVSLAIALMGNPEVILLDEPSSGLDAAAKRVLWRTLQAVSHGRSIVLTTHSMEEAEAVCSVVGIISGRMLALGPREEIKRRGGGGAFHIHLEAASGHSTTLEETERIQKFALGSFPGATLDRDMAGGQIRFQVPFQSGNNIADLFALLERAKTELNLSSYSVGRPTLDQVFVNIVTEHGGKEEDSGGAKKSWFSRS